MLTDPSGKVSPRRFQNSSVAWAVPLLLSGSVYLLISALIVRAVLRGSLRMVAPGVTWPVVTITVLFSVASILSGAGVVLAFSPGLLVLSLIWSLLVSAIALVAAVARAFLQEGPSA